ncbi:MAG TPA: hypothetical protein PKZ97_03835 [Azospirillaceae bacterium]|nr:hypothetical protein [Azospirillaceae bacterium]
MSFVVFSPRDAVFAGLLAERLATLNGAPAEHFAVEPRQEAPASVDGVALTWGGVRLDAARGIYVGGFRYEDPVLPPPSLEADWSFWQSRHVLRQQSYSFMWSLLSRVEAAGARLYNPPSAHLNLFCRQRPLDQLRAAGLPAVATTLTNDPAMAAEAQARHQTTVWRPANGRAAWQVFRDKQRQHLVGADRPPVLLAPAAPGVLVRLYVVNGEIALALTAAPPARDAVERFEVLLGVDPATLPGATDAARRATEVLNLNWAILTALSDDDGVTFYDVDPDPAMDDLPAAVQAHLADALACGMIGRPIPAAPAALREPRDTLLLRRMLVIQFEMEATKHAP